MQHPGAGSAGSPNWWRMNSGMLSASKKTESEITLTTGTIAFTDGASHGVITAEAAGLITTFVSLQQ
ncbi:MAG: hypothetical protein DHS20C04_27510 [Hyphococcus sp.]|nr:MAG: hypothetical protein DHS20C04_27510 [Marinicaulis sp.]